MKEQDYIPLGSGFEAFAMALALAGMAGELGEGEKRDGGSVMAGF